MRENELEKLFDKLFNNVLGITMLLLFTSASVVNVLVTLARGSDKMIHNSDGFEVTSKIISTPWPACWSVEKWIILLTVGPVVANALIAAFRDRVGKTPDGLTRKDRKALKAAESKARLHEKIERLEREVAV